MMTNSESDNRVHVGESSSVHLLPCRMVWMMFGPMGLLFMIYAIVINGNGWFTVSSAIYGVVLALMVGCRWVEQRSGTATTATGEPASIEHFRRYVRIMLPVAVVVWVTANVMGNHILT